MDKKTKERVNLRKRLMPSGNTSLYLDVFTKEGRKYEYLKLYLVPEHTRADNLLIPGDSRPPIPVILGHLS